MLTKTCIISSVLAACVAVSCTFTTSSAFATTEESPRNVSWEEKIDSAIWQSDVDESGRYLVYVSRTGISDSKIEKEFNKRSEYPLSYYKDKTIYRAKVGPEVASYALEKYGFDESLSLEYGQDIFDDNVAPIEYELLENYNEFVMSKRNVITDLYGTYNESFAERVGISEDAVLYEGIYTGSYVMYATRNEVEKIAKDKSVTAVSVWENDIVNSSSEQTDVETQIKIDSTNGTKSASFNNGSGYKGTGIKIGVIETNGGKFNKNAPMLSSIYKSRVFYEYNGDIDPSTTEHATKVVSLIIGQSVNFEGEIFEGVVPNATVYQTSYETSASFIDGLQILANCGVSVINVSNTMTSDSEVYCQYTKETDNFIVSAGILLVKSAGNEGLDDKYVTVPGMGYNIITVGNVETISCDSNGNRTACSVPYSIASSSSYKEKNNFQNNKPDLVAPGSNLAIPILDDNGNVILKVSSGTSYAAPFVTGIIAQMFQADETLMDSPSRAKATLLAGADPTVISSNNNDSVYTDTVLIRDKSGVGMVNAINAVKIAEDSNHANKIIYMNLSSTNGKQVLDTVTLSAGQKIRVALTYVKSNSIETDSNGYLPYDADLKLYNGSTLCASSGHSHCNVEVIEFTATSAGTYTVIADTDYDVDFRNDNSWAVAVAWRIN